MTATTRSRAKLREAITAAERIPGEQPSVSAAVELNNSVKAEVSQAAHCSGFAIDENPDIRAN